MACHTAVRTCHACSERGIASSVMTLACPANGQCLHVAYHAHMGVGPGGGAGGECSGNAVGISQGEEILAVHAYEAIT